MKKIKYSEILTEKNILCIQEIVKNHGVLIYPTDTLYGIGGDFFSHSVIEKIDKLKKRMDVPYSVAISGLKMLRELVSEIPDIFYEIYENLLPGTFTLLLKASPDISKSILKSSKKIGVRFPNLPELLQLIDILKTPLISTSVNLSGQKPLNDPKLITQYFSSVDLMIDAGILRESLGSTVLDITETPVKCIRKGDHYRKLIEMGIRMVIE